MTAQVEALLKKQDTAESSTVASPGDASDSLNTGPQSRYPEFDITYATNDSSSLNTLNLFPDISQSQAHAHLFSAIPEDNIYEEPPNDPYDGMSWELIELGVDEPLPLQETIDDL